jgi:ribosomal subunit interface protein
MHVQINFSDVAKSDALVDRVHKELDRKLKRFGERITRVEVHLRDDSGHHRGGVDKRCTLEARPAGGQPVAVESESDDLYTAIKEAAEKLERALARRLERAEG